MDTFLQGLIGQEVTLKHDREGEFAKGVLVCTCPDTDRNYGQYKVGDWPFEGTQVSSNSEGTTIELCCGVVLCGHHKKVHEERDSTCVMLGDSMTDVCCECGGLLAMSGDTRFDEENREFDGSLDELKELLKRAQDLHALVGKPVVYCQFGHERAGTLKFDGEWYSVEDEHGLVAGTGMFKSCLVGRIEGGKIYLK